MKTKVVVCGQTSDTVTKVAAALKDSTDIVLITQPEPLTGTSTVIYASVGHYMKSLFAKIDIPKKQSEGRRFDGTPKRRNW